MDTSLVVFLIGMAAGSGIVALVLRGRIRQARELGALERLAELRVLEARLDEAVHTAAGLRDSLADREREMTDLRDTAIALTAEAAALREAAGRIPQLESGLEERDGRIGSLTSANTSLRETLAELHTRLDEERSAAEEKLALLTGAREQLSVAFKALSSDALKHNSTSFLELAITELKRHHSEAGADLAQRQEAIRTLVEPLQKSLGTLDTRINDIERDRQQAFGSIREHLASITAQNTRLEIETGNLVRALRQPAARGRWGEIQLRRVTEMAGMVEYCDFVEQETAPGATVLRPDMTIRLPNGRRIAVDSKAPMEAYLQALEAATDAERTQHMERHARQIADHIAKLSRKQYWEQFDAAPEFVVLFLPGENFFSAALQQRPELIERGVSEKVLIATPTTLIALLKAVAYGWNQERTTQNAREIARLGRELHERIMKFTEHFIRLRLSLTQAVASYNDAAGSLERRVLVTTRRFKDLGAAPDTDIPLLDPIDESLRSIEG